MLIRAKCEASMKLVVECALKVGVATCSHGMSLGSSEYPTE